MLDKTIKIFWQKFIDADSEEREKILMKLPVVRSNIDDKQIGSMRSYFDDLIEYIKKV